MTLTTLPELKPEEDMHIFEKSAQISVDVLVRVKGFKHLSIGRYIHAAGEWQVDGYHGDWEVLEWWDLPKIGTGKT